VSRLPCQAHKAEEQESEARGIGPALTGLFEEVIDPVQPENTHDDQIDRHRDANDAGRDQQKYSRGQAGNRHQGVGGIEVHRELIPDSEAPSAGRCGLASALVPVDRYMRPAAAGLTGGVRRAIQGDFKWHTLAAAIPANGRQPAERPARDNGELTVTCQNRRLRGARREVWREADTIRGYWKARTEMENAISRAQSHGLPEGNNHPPHDPDERWTLLTNWRQAIAQQLLTPAPDTAAVAWKKAALATVQSTSSNLTI
jgi:hypothetical protein